MGPNTNESTASKVSTAYWCMRWRRGPCSISGAKSAYNPRALVALLKSLGQAFLRTGIWEQSEHCVCRCLDILHQAVQTRHQRLHQRPVARSRHRLELSACVHYLTGSYEAGRPFEPMGWDLHLLRVL